MLNFCFIGNEINEFLERVQSPWMKFLLVRNKLMNLVKKSSSKSCDRLRLDRLASESRFWEIFIIPKKTPASQLVNELFDCLDLDVFKFEILLIFSRNT